jgi:hypothetical protein
MLKIHNVTVKIHNIQYITHGYMTLVHVDRILGLFLTLAYGSRVVRTLLTQIASRNKIRVVPMHSRQTVNGVSKQRRITAN